MGAFLPFLFAKYSNSDGVQPKLIFRHYNVAGWGKYLKSHLEFIPTDNLNLYLLYDDKEVMNNPNISYKIETTYKTSIINYYANYDEQNGNSRDTAPFGVFNGSPDLLEAKWNDELFLQGIFKTNFVFFIPNYKISIKPSLTLDYKYILADDSLDQVPGHIINPITSINFSIPIKKVYYQPTFDANYKLTLGNGGIKYDIADTLIPTISRQNYLVKNAALDELSLKTKQLFSFSIPTIKATIQPHFGLEYTLNTWYKYHYYYDKSLTMSPTMHVNHLDLLLGLNFIKNFNYKKTRHTFKLTALYTQCLVGPLTVVKKYWMNNRREDPYITVHRYSNSFQLNFDFYYTFNLTFLKKHNFIMKWHLIANYNDLYEHSDGYKIGIQPGDLYGWLGVITNFKYTLPLFTLKTPRWGSFNVDKVLNWEVFWDFYIDAGLLVNDTEEIRNYDDAGETYNSYTINYNNLHLYPALGVGTSIRVKPKFIVTEIQLDIGLDIYKAYKYRSIDGGTIILSLSFNDKF